MHWWYFPDSYDEVIEQDDAPEVIEPDKQPEGEYQMISLPGLRTLSFCGIATFLSAGLWSSLQDALQKGEI